MELSEYSFERVSNNEERLKAESALLSQVFQGTDRYTRDYLKWQYFENPDGDIVGFDAYQGDTIAAHYVVEPLEARLFGKVSRGVLSLNTATHPAHQGKGLFVRLASKTYDAARDQGYEFVIGVANANSTPGFIRKLGFQLVAPLEAQVGIGTVESSDPESVDFERLWSDAARRWRLSNPAGRYARRRGRLYSESHNPMIRMQLSTEPWDGLTSKASRLGPINAWIGLHPRRRWRGISLPVPKKMRPSPLNFIFLDLTGQNRQLESSKVIMDAVCFDAY